jgi:hypothetical protein
MLEYRAAEQQWLEPMTAGKRLRVSLGGGTADDGCGHYGADEAGKELTEAMEQGPPTVAIWH